MARNIRRRSHGKRLRAAPPHAEKGFVLLLGEYLVKRTIPGRAPICLMADRDQTNGVRCWGLKLTGEIIGEIIGKTTGEIIG